MLWTYADRRDDGVLRAGRRRRLRPGDRHLRARARSTPTTSPAPPSSTCATGSRPAPPPAGTRRTSCCAALDLPADHHRPERRQRRALDAARRHPQPQRRPGRAARPVRQRRVLLAGPHHLGAGRGLRRVPGRRPGVRARSCGSASPSPSTRSTGRCSTRYGEYLQHRRRAHARLADRRRRGRLGRGGARALGVRRGRRQRRGRGPRCASWPRASPQLGGGDAAHWPFGALLPVGAVAVGSGTPGPRRCRPRWPVAADALGDGARWRRPAARDSFTFDPWLLTSGGPDNGRLPTRVDRHADRLRRRLARPVAARHSDATGRRVGADLAGIAGRVVLRRQRLRRTDVRPGHRRHLSTASTATASSTATPAPSPRSTACCRCSPSTRTRAPPRSPAPRPSWTGVGTTTLAGRGRHARRRRHRGRAGVGVDRRVAVRRRRLRRARRRRHRHASTWPTGRPRW